MNDISTSLEECNCHLPHFITVLSESYDTLYNSGIDLTNLANAIDALMFAHTKLKEQKVICDRIKEIQAEEK